MFKVNLELLENEEVETVKACNHFKGIESVGGKIFITNKRIAFKSHKGNIQNNQLDINYDDIDEIGFYNTLGLVPNGMSIKTKSGNHEKFVVWGRKPLKKLIESKMDLQ